MAITVGELQAQLAALDPQRTIMVAVNGAIAPVTGVNAPSGASFIVVRGRGIAQTSNRFSTAEAGVLGHLSQLGLDDAAIGEVLGRPAESIKRKRKALGLA